MLAEAAELSDTSDSGAGLALSCLSRVIGTQHFYKQFTIMVVMAPRLRPSSEEILPLNKNNFGAKNDRSSATANLCSFRQTNNTSAGL